MREFFKHLFRGDLVLWITILLLCIVSSIEMFSAISQEANKASYYLAPFLSHLKHLGLGLIVLVIMHFVPYQKLRPAYPLVLVLAFILLIWLYVAGQDINGAQRAVKILGVGFQPFEVVKLGILLFMADMLARNQEVDAATAKRNFGIMLGVLVLFCAMVLPQNLSTAVLIFTVSFVMMVVGRVSWKYIGMLVGGITLLVVIAWGLSSIDFTRPFMPHRITTWMERINEFAGSVNSSAEAPLKITDDNRQILNSEIAIALGKEPCGPGNSIQRDYLPLAFSDFIYAIIIEEWGTFAGIFIMLLYMFILYRAGRIAHKSSMAYPALLVMGLSVMMVLQAFISMAVTVHLGPVTGQPLPLISRGGTSIVVTCIYLGMMLSISQSINTEEEKENPSNT